MPDRGGEPADERSRYRWLMAGVTLAGLVLRVVSLGSDLWLDEVTSLLAFGQSSFWQVIVTHAGFGNHLLNTLSVKAAIGLLGEREWVVRLPAMVWGTATIPAFYWVARQAFSRRGSLAAALLLAVSYHHIFFSQDSRGYSAYVCLSLVASVLLIKALRAGAVRMWGAYVMASVLNIVALLIAGFVVAGHAIVAAVVTVAAGRRGQPCRPAAGRVAVVFATIGVLGALPYAAVLSDIVGTMGSTYADEASGLATLSPALIVDLVREMAGRAGTGLVLAAVPAACLAGLGYIVLLRRRWMLTAALTLPLLLQGIFFGVLDYIFSPRLFILALPLCILASVQAIELVSAAAARLLARDERAAHRIAWAAVLVLCAASLAALPGYYRVPKQPYRASLEYIEQARGSSGIVIVIQYAEGGVRYYLARDHPDARTSYFYARSPEAVDAVLADHPGRPAWLITTFSNALRAGSPDLDARIRREWDVDRTFDATIGDGALVVWRPGAR